MLKNSLVLKKIIRNIKLMAIGIAGLTILNTQNILFEKMLSINDGTDVIGAGYTQSTVKLWGYVIFAGVILISTFKAIKNFKEQNSRKVLRYVLTIPGYLVVLFIVTASFDGIFVSSNKLDKEKEYLQYNIENTKRAYNIDIEETDLNHSGTITEEDVKNNSNLFNNIAIINESIYEISPNEDKSWVIDELNNLRKHIVNIAKIWCPVKKVMTTIKKFGKLLHLPNRLNILFA